jgi:ankyrin repeat protein
MGGKGEIMKIRSLIAWGAAVLGFALLTLPLVAQNTAKGQQAKPQILDLGDYRVSPPPTGRWETETDENGNVTFAKDGGRTTISVMLQTLELGDWQKSENEVVEFNWNVLAVTEFRSKAYSGKIGEKGETLRKDKKVYYMRIQKQAAADGRTWDAVCCQYFPSPFRKRHVYFFCRFTCPRPKKSANPQAGPDLEPVLSVIESLEIADPVKLASGPDAELVRAAAAGDAEAVRRAIEGGVSVDARVPEFSALSAAAYFGRREIVDLLLERGANINKAEEIDGHTPLLRAIMGGEPEIAAGLVERGADVNRGTEAGFSALMVAVGGGHSALVSTLVGKGAEVNAKDEDGETALMFAANGSAEIARFLIANGADVNIQMDDGWTALMQAVFRGNAGIAGLLLDAGADVNNRSVNGWTALMAAITPASFRGNPGLVELLIGKGADLDASMTENGQAPLHLALFSEEPEIAKMLVVAGADINLRMKSGTTPLMAAATAGLAEMVRLLIERGAEVNAIAEGNRTALKIAREKQNAEIVKILLAAGAK